MKKDVDGGGRRKSSGKISAIPKKSADTESNPTENADKKEELSFKGHRQRTKEAIRAEGITNRYEHAVLEFILFYCIPYKDTKPIAYELINKFGNLYGVFNAPPELIENVKGITRDAATFLSALSGICERYADESGKRETIAGIDGVLRYMKRVVVPNVEACYIISVSVTDEVISVEKLLEGSNNSLDIPMSLLVKTILNANAKRVIILHNHPSGKVVPSREDVANTYVLSSMLDTMGVELIDHLVVYEYFVYSISGKRVYKHRWSDS